MLFWPQRPPLRRPVGGGGGAAARGEEGRKEWAARMDAAGRPAPARPRARVPARPLPPPSALLQRARRHVGRPARPSAGKPPSKLGEPPGVRIVLAAYAGHAGRYPGRIAG